MAEDFKEVQRMIDHGGEICDRCGHRDYSSAFEVINGERLCLDCQQDVDGPLGVA